MSDTERVKLLGSQNSVVHRPIAAASAGAQALFDLGLMQAWGFERGGAAENFEVGRCYRGIREWRDWSRCRILKLGLSTRAAVEDCQGAITASHLYFPPPSHRPR
jgi:hypothetical protein